LAGELIRQALAKAQHIGLSEIWLWTKEKTAPMYEKYGWIKKEDALYHHEKINIMQYPLQ